MYLLSVNLLIISSKFASSCPARRKQNSELTKKQWKKTKDHGLLHLIKSNPKIYEPNKCIYCGEPAEFQLKNGNWCCHQFATQCPTNRKKNKDKIKSLYSKNENSDVIFNGKLRKDEYTEERRKKQGWSKGLTKFNNNLLKERGERLSQKYKNGELIPSWQNRQHTKEEIDKIVYRNDTF